jgi:YkoY family integral membrane protein
MFEITTHDLFLIGFLVFLEGILSIDNALVLAMMARHLPPAQQKKALTYGLIGAVVFRLLSLLIVTQLIRWRWVKFVGGGYLIFVAVRHFWEHRTIKDEAKVDKPRGMSFWRTVVMIELMDIAFAVDSILAAVALTNKFWIVFAGGFMGVVMMRFAARGFLVLLKKFPGFETTAYLLVFVIGLKVIVEALHLPGVDFHSASSPSFWVFWGTMLACIVYGFRRK